VPARRASASPVAHRPDQHRRPQGRRQVRAAARAREFALQGLYQRLVGRHANSPTSTPSRATWPASPRSDTAALSTTLLTGRVCGDRAPASDALLTRLARPQAGLRSRPSSTRMTVDRRLRVPALPRTCPGAWCSNECIELAGEFGGTRWPRCVNAVLDRLAARLRAAKVGHDDQVRAPPRLARPGRHTHADHRARPAHRALLRDGGGQGGVEPGRQVRRHSRPRPWSS